MADKSNKSGRSIQIFLINGTPNGLVQATLKGWTGSVLIARNDTLPDLLKRPEAKRVGLYLLYGPDPEDELSSRVYIGEGDVIRKRLPNSARERSFWETVAVITTSDESLTKAHARFLEGRLIDLTAQAGRVTLDNVQSGSDERYLPEADAADMEYFLQNLEIIMPIVGMDLFKRAPRQSAGGSTSATFVIDRKDGAKARAVEADGEFLILKGSVALKDAGYASNSYRSLKRALEQKGSLVATDDPKFLRFAEDVPFKSPSAAAAVVLDRNANGRTEWKVEGTKQTYDQWQQAAAANPEPQ